MCIDDWTIGFILVMNVVVVVCLLKTMHACRKEKRKNELDLKKWLNKKTTR